MGLRDAFRNLVGSSVEFDEPAPILEASGYSLPGIDKDENLYRQIGGNYVGTGRRVHKDTVMRGVELARYFYDTNPLAHGIVDTVKDFVVGEGFVVKVAILDKDTKRPLSVGQDAPESIKKTQDEAQLILDRHWFDPINNWVLKQHQRVRELGMDGEQIYPVFVNEVDGHVRIGLIDPLSVRAVYYNPDNLEECIAVEVAGKSPSESKFYRVIHIDEEPLSPTKGRLIGAQEGEVFIKKTRGKERRYPYVGSCFYFAVNRHSSSDRGRSDLLSVVDWLGVHDKILFQFADRYDMMYAFQWDVMIQNADDTRLQEWIKKHGTQSPKPGTVRVHNENETWTAVSPQMRAEDNEFGLRALKATILAALGLPPFWFAEGSETTRATALEMGTPALKRLGSRQLEVQHLIEQIMQFQLDQVLIANKLSEEYDYKVIVEAPEMSTRDLTRAGSSLLSVMSGMQIALEQRVVDPVAAQEIFVNLVGQLGVDINLEEMQRRIEEMPDPTDDPLHPSFVNPEEMELQKQAIQNRGQGFSAAGNANKPSGGMKRRGSTKGAGKSARQDPDPGLNKNAD